MKLTGLRPILWTEDLRATIDFYTHIFNFTCNEVNKDWGWASLSKDYEAIMLAAPNEHTKYEKIVFTGSFYFNTDDVDGLWKQLKDKARICYAIDISIGRCANLRFMTTTATFCNSVRK